jgi:hypothetical protein
VTLNTASRARAEQMRPNRSIDTDVLSAGFARLLAAGHFRRYAAGRSVLFSLNSGEVKSQRAWRASFAAVLLRPLASET